ncbi:WD-40 repeat protein [Plakobranchus ocellatus]|uniref:WD-40 repeat protein n=1 Tax=Plakobranchus ocellatus TaxID=259542 RepID=A0AAV4AEP8_9GAST|nr:WD-40 repeat protein [Plakobranchus ocellatus]
MFEYPIMMDVFGGSGSEGDSDEGPGITMDQVDTLMAASTHLHFSPDSSMLVSTSNDGRIRIIDTETGRKRLLTGGYRSIYVWHVGNSDEDLAPEARGQLEVKLTRHANFVTCLQLVLEDRFLITASVDKSIALWSMKTRTTLCVFRYHCAINHMQAAPDLSTISFIPERSSTAAVLTLNKAARAALSGIPTVAVPVKVKKAQAVALSFSSQQVTTKTSTACTIL